MAASKSLRSSSSTSRNITYNENYGPFFAFSLRLAFSMQIIGFLVRLLSSLLWIQMYRLGASSLDSVSYHEAFYRRSFLSPSLEDVARQSSMSDNTLGSYVRIASPYAPLFEDAQDKGYASEGDKQSNVNGGLLSASEGFNSRPFHVKDFVKVAICNFPILDQTLRMPSSS